jgi:hypothetical protein
MREDRDEPWDAGELCAGFTLPGFPSGRSPQEGWPEAVVVHVEEDTLDRPVESAVQAFARVVSPVRPRLRDRYGRLEELTML